MKIDPKQALDSAPMLIAAANKMKRLAKLHQSTNLMAELFRNHNLSMHLIRLSSERN